MRLSSDRSLSGGSRRRLALSLPLSSLIPPSSSISRENGQAGTQRSFSAPRNPKKRQEQGDKRYAEDERRRRMAHRP